MIFYNDFTIFYEGIYSSSGVLRGFEAQDGWKHVGRLGFRVLVGPGELS